VGQNVYLQAADLALETVMVGAFDDVKVKNPALPDGVLYSMVNGVPHHLYGFVYSALRFCFHASTE